jgi:hypothetical protein
MFQRSLGHENLGTDSDIKWNRQCDVFIILFDGLQSLAIRCFNHKSPWSRDGSWAHQMSQFLFMLPFALILNAQFYSTWNLVVDLVNYNWDLILSGPNCTADLYADTHPYGPYIYFPIS